MRKLLTIVLAISLGLAFFWLVVMKVVSRVAASFGVSGPCPYELSWLVDNPIRRNAVPRLLDRVGIRPGERVLELGPGPGAFTVEAARRAGPQGRLIAVDIQPAMIAQVEERVRRAGLTGSGAARAVETHVASAHSLPLPAASIDRAFLISVERDSDPDRALAGLLRAGGDGVVDRRGVSGSRLRLPRGDDPAGRSRGLPGGRTAWQLLGVHAEFLPGGGGRAGLTCLELRDPWEQGGRMSFFEFGLPVTCIPAAPSRRCGRNPRRRALLPLPCRAAVGLDALASRISRRSATVGRTWAALATA